MHTPTLLTLALTLTTTSALTLPVYHLHPIHTDPTTATKLAQQLFSLPSIGKSFTQDTRHTVLSPDGTKRLELDTISGAFWAADDSQLLNTDLHPKLLDARNSLQRAEELVAKYALLPELKGPVKVLPGRVGGTFIARESGVDGQLRREERQLDVSVNYDIVMSIPVEGTKAVQEFPVLGGGGKFQLTFGDGGRLIGYQGLWREIAEDVKEYAVISKEQADKEFLAAGKYIADSVDFNTTIAYYSAPAGEFQEFLYPVYVYDGTIKSGDETIQLRRSYVPATEFGPIDMWVPEEQPLRKLDDPTVSRRRSLHRRTADDGVREAGTEWLGVPYGLKKTEQNAKGFRDQLKASKTSWNINFNWGNELVWQSDFGGSDDIWVDSVDFLFYTGHAGMNGWMANQPGTGVRQDVDFSIVGAAPGNPGDLWGQQDLEWLVIAACGPHQDAAFVAGGGNVFDRWRGAFDGLHIMFAYGSLSSDVDDEGRRLVKYAQEGSKLVDAWFRTAKELQGSSVVVTAMWASGPGGNARDDHLNDYGYISGDNVGSSQERWFLWSTC